LATCLCDHCFGWFSRLHAGLLRFARPTASGSRSGSMVARVGCHSFATTESVYCLSQIRVASGDASSPLRVEAHRHVHRIVSGQGAFRCGPNSLCGCVTYTASICFWIACDGIDGSKISTLGPSSGFAASAGRAAASSEAAEPNCLRSRSARLPDIGPHRLRGQRRLEELPVVLHREGLRKISGV
jgi:hypothetical protein